MIELPNLNDLCDYDHRLRQYVREPEVIREAIVTATNAYNNSDNAEDKYKSSGWLADAYRVIGESDLAKAWAFISLEYTNDKNLPERRLRSIAAMIRLGEIYRCADDYPSAEMWLERAIRSIGFDSVARQRYLAFASQHLGKTYMDHGDLASARSHLERALNMRIRAGDETLIASSRRAVARLEKLEERVHHVE